MNILAKLGLGPKEKPKASFYHLEQKPLSKYPPYITAPNGEVFYFEPTYRRIKDRAALQPLIVNMILDGAGYPGYELAPLDPTDTSPAAP